MIRAALRDLLKKKRGKSRTLLFSEGVAACGFKNVLIISWMLCCLSSDKREQDRGSRQQDLKDQGLGRGGTTAVSVGRAAMNQQTPAKSTFGDAVPDMMPHFNALFKSCGLADDLVMCFLLRAAGSDLSISRRVSHFHLICMFGFVYYANLNSKKKKNLDDKQAKHSSLSLIDVAAFCKAGSFAYFHKEVIQMLFIKRGKHQSAVQKLNRAKRLNTYGICKCFILVNKSEGAV